MCANITQNNNWVVLTLDFIDSDLVMFYHVTKIGGAVHIKCSKVIALNSFGPLDTVMRFKFPKDLFQCIVERRTHSSTDTQTFNSTKDFVILMCKEKNKKFRNIILVSPCIAAAFLEMSPSAPGNLACVAKLAVESFKNDSGRHSYFKD